jgi:hypothetical protein
MSSSRPRLAGLTRPRAYANLSASQGPFTGVSFSNADRSGVWFEGTAHMAAGLLARNASGDPAKAAAYLQSVQ